MKPTRSAPVFAPNSVPNQAWYTQLRKMVLEENLMAPQFGDIQSPT